MTMELKSNSVINGVDLRQMTVGEEDNKNIISFIYIRDRSRRYIARIP